MATFGYETYDSYPTYDPYEEERLREEERRRLEAETPTKQTVTINPDGTKDVTISGSATNLAQMSQQSRARAMPIPTAPVAPDTYQRMLQIESGNRDYTASGAPVTSPAGAMFASQVMPATAARPGYGIQPAQAQTPEEYNRVGREYFDAMKKKYGGNDELAAAAYHSGPGNVDRALQQSQATGQDWRTYLGPQGQAYVAAAVPGRQAAAAPVAPEAPAPTAAAPAAAPVAPSRLGEFAGVEQAIAKQAAQPAAPVPTTAQTEAALAQQGKERYVNEFIAAQNSPKDMVAFINNPEAPEELRNQMEKSYYDALKTKYRLNETSDRFRNAVQSGDTKQVAKMMNAPGEEGSIVKAFLFSLIGFQSGAQAEVAKMNLPGKWQAAANEAGERGMIQYSTSGMPLRGIKSDGTPMDDQELAAYASQGGAGKVTTSGTFFQTPTGQVLRAQSDEQGRTRLVDAASGARYTGSTNNLVKLEEAGALRKMDRGLVIDLAKKHGQNVLEAEKEYVQLNGPFKSADERQQFRDAYGFGLSTPAPVGGVAGYGGAAAPAAPAQGPVVPTAPAAPAAPAVSGAATPAVPAAVPAAVPTTAAKPAVGVTTPIAEQKQAKELAGAQAKENIQVAGKRSESFNRILDEEVRPQAQIGDEVASLRKQQFKLFDRPNVDASKIFGIANGAGQPAGDQRWTMFRDVLLGKVSVPEDKIRERAAALGLNREEQSALAEYNNLNATVNARTLKSTAGAGSVSDAEQRANRERNVDPTQMPALGAYNSMAQSQFNADLARYKGDWAQNSTATNALQLDKEWRKIQQGLVNNYIDVAKQRLEYISKNGSTAAAVKEGYRLFPIPEYDPATETWKKTRPLGSYDR